MDHFFFYDDGSSDGTLEALRDCVSPILYTVYNSSFIAATDPESLSRYSNSNRKPQMHQWVIYSKLYARVVRAKTQWLAIIDVDEFITSRSHPHLTIKELLQQQPSQQSGAPPPARAAASFHEVGQLSNCDVISVPWIMFSWAGRQHTPRNAARYALDYRWGYGQQFAIRLHSDPPLEAPPPPTPQPVDLRHLGPNSRQAGPKKAPRRRSHFFNKVEAEFNKVLVRTDRVGSVSLHNARPSQKGFVCIPHTSSSLHCARNSTRAQVQQQDLAAFAPVMQDWARSGGRFRDASGSYEGLPEWCPPLNRFHALDSFPRTLLREEDLDGLQLAVFHYRIKSDDEWRRKKGEPPKPALGAAAGGGGGGGAGGQRRWTDKYHVPREEADRLDVRDAFLREVRLPARRAHPAFLQAEQALQLARQSGRCPARYFEQS